MPGPDSHHVRNLHQQQHTSKRVRPSLRTVITLVLIMLLLSACSDYVPGPGRIAFVSNRDGNNDVYMVNPDGTGLTNVSQDPADDRLPQWSPDGQYLAFLSVRSGVYGIYRLGIDGHQPLLLTDRLNVDSMSWSPDGQALAFSAEEVLTHHIYAVDADGANLRQLTDAETTDTLPVWSPDGERIAFVRVVDNVSEVWVMDSDGSDVVQVTVDPETVKDGLSWSPDGQQILFTGTAGLENNVYVVKADGSDLTQLTPDEDSDRVVSGAWSPRGWIVFSSIPQGPPYEADLFVMAADGSDRRQLTEDDNLDIGPVWSPDGSQVVYTSGQAITYNVFVVDVAGGQPFQLTNAPGQHDWPAWSPATVPPIVPATE